VKRRLVKLLQRRLINPRTSRTAGNPGQRYALLETIGRKSGQPRQTPVGDGLDGDLFWIVAEHGRAADYVRNIDANPRVRIKVNGQWRDGTARILADDDPVERLKSVDPRTASEVKRLGTALLTNPGRPGSAGRFGIEHHLRAPEQRDRAAGRLVRNDCVPDLRPLAGVHSPGISHHRAFPNRAQEVGLELDGREPGRALRKAGEAPVAASRVGQACHRPAMQIAMGRLQPPGRLEPHPAVAVSHFQDLDSEEPGEGIPAESRPGCGIGWGPR
jgi:deazaflavin-dependent oxidoreductase (nitroreductase family)